MPHQLVNQALAVEGNIGVAFTYNEPGISYEYLIDTAPLLEQAGLATVMVTNGYLSPEPWKDLCGVVDAMNIDVKSFNVEFYERICGGQLEVIKANVLTAFQAGVHLELTHLVVPGLNDRIEEFTRLVDWVAGISPQIPLHISRYFPRYLETAPATSPAVIAVPDIARKRLEYVYAGNIRLHQDTRCPECGMLWISRHDYLTKTSYNSAICSCGRRLPFILEKQKRQHHPVV